VLHCRSRKDHDGCAPELCKRLPQCQSDATLQELVMDLVFMIFMHRGLFVQSKSRMDGVWARRTRGADLRRRIFDLVGMLFCSGCIAVH
jgi:hypothetical protein